MHSNKYTQSSSPIMQPRSVSFALSCPHFSHLKLWPESCSGIMPDIVSFLVIVSGNEISVWVVGVLVLQRKQIRWLSWKIRRFLQVSQNWSVILFGRDFGFYWFRLLFCNSKLYMLFLVDVL